MSDTLKNEILHLLDGLHKVKTNLFFDPLLLRNKTVADEIAQINKLIQRMKLVYNVITGEPAPIAELPRLPGEHDPQAVVESLDDLYVLLKRDLEAAGHEMPEVPEYSGKPDKLSTEPVGRPRGLKKKDKYHNKKPGRKPRT